MKTILKKISYIILMLLLISVVSFLAIHSALNSFFGVGELNPNMTKEAIAQLKAIYGLDKTSISIGLLIFSPRSHSPYGNAYTIVKQTLPHIV